MLTRKHMEAVVVEDRGHWDEVLYEIGVYDFYHMAAFHKLAELRGEGSPMMAVFREEGWTVAFPLLVREIDLPWADCGQVDATSVVGMAGPVAQPGLPEEIRTHWLAGLRDFFLQHGIVSVYSRLNYAIDQSSLLSGCGALDKRHTEVVMDLTIPPDEQLARYEHGHREQAAKLRKMGFVCRMGGLEHLDEFMTMYQESLVRLGAAPDSSLDLFFFDYLLRKMPEHIRFIICKDGAKTAVTGLFSECNGIVHGLYMGMDPDYRRFSPFKLLIDDLRQWANARGCRLMLLGSGRTLVKDSLYHFKMGFGGQERAYCTWSHIADPTAYDELCHAAFRRAGMEPEDTYFPMYRHPALSAATITGAIGSLLVGMSHEESKPI